LYLNPLVSYQAGPDCNDISAEKCPAGMEKRLTDAHYYFLIPYEIKELQAGISFAIYEHIIQKRRLSP